MTASRRWMWAVVGLGLMSPGWAAAQSTGPASNAAERAASSDAEPAESDGVDDTEPNGTEPDTEPGAEPADTEPGAERADIEPGTELADTEPGTELADTEQERAEAPDVSTAPSESGADFEGVEELLDGIAPLNLQLDDGSGDEVPWYDYDPYAELGPEGRSHVGMKLRVAALLTVDGREPADGPMLELSGFFDHRFSRYGAFHIRVALGVSWQLHTESFLGAGRWYASSPGALRLRVQPLAMDFGHHVTFRLGPSLGAQLVPRAAESGFSVEILAGGTAELVLRLIDGLLEIGLHGGVQMTGVGTRRRPNAREPGDPWSTGLHAQAVVGGSVAGVLP